MRKGRVWLMGIAISLSFSAVGCGSDKKSSTISALDDAYKSGVLTRAEYETKRAAILGSSAPVVQAAPPQPAASPRSSYLILKKADVVDQSGFERPMVSASMLMPSDWQYQAATQWNIKDSCNTIATTMRASGPDGRGFEVFPAYAWTWADDPRPLQLLFSQKAQMGTHACDVMAPMSASDFLRRNLPRVRPNAQIVALEPLPKLMQILQQQARQTEQSAMQYRLQQRVRPDTIRARLRYSVNGQSVEEWLVVTTVTTGTLGPSMNAAGQMTQAYSYSCNAAAFAERAPQGQLESSEQFFDMLVSTIRVNPEWQRRVSGVSAANFKVEHEEIGKRSAITRQLGEDMGNIRRQGAEHKARSEDHVFGEYSQSTRDVETYRNPISGETWDLSNQYGHAWVNDRNEFVLSDQEGWDPNVALKGNWTAMQHVRQ